MRTVLFAFVLTAAAHAYALRPELAGTTQLWLVLGGAYMVLGAIALHRLWDEGTLLDVLQPRWGDLSIGSLTTVVLMVSSWGARAVIAPLSSERHAWLVRIYLQIGPSEGIQRSTGITLAVLAIAALEELTWRGLVLDKLTERFGSRFAWMAATLLYALALVPTAFTLRDDVAGLNPLLPLAGLGCGLVWTFLAARLGRLPPVIVSHMAFTYFSVVQFRLPGT